MQDRQAEFLQRLRAFQPTPWNLLPDLGLYMDQVITYIQKECRGLYPADERVVTPAMVNNYVKFGLVDRPIGKKYGREQLAQLIVLVTLKGVATMDELKRLIALPKDATPEDMYAGFCQTIVAVCSDIEKRLPLGSPMECVAQAAAYRFLCQEVLAPEKAAEKAPESKPEVKQE